MRYTLGPVRHAPLFGIPEVVVRIAEDMTHSVVFFGYEDATDGKGGIECIGSGFLLEHDGAPYLITAKHIADELRNDPFLVRINKKDRTAENLRIDNARWYSHPDPRVDISVIPFLIPRNSLFECSYIPAQFVITAEKMQNYDIGVGSLTYTVGLFRLLSGEKRNLPITYMGNIAMLPREERVPVIDWNDPEEEKTIMVEAFLVASQSLNGLSGSPVFVRPEVDLDFGKVLKGEEVEEKTICGPHTQIQLLGLWQGAWRAKPDEIRAAQLGKEVTVPVGVGIVVPYTKIVETLEGDDVKKARELFKGSHRVAAKLDSVKRRKRPSGHAHPGSDENPTHREDFNSLLNAAARKLQPKD